MDKQTFIIKALEWAKKHPKTLVQYKDFCFTEAEKVTFTAHCYKKYYTRERYPIIDIITNTSKNVFKEQALEWAKNHPNILVQYNNRYIFHSIYWSYQVPNIGDYYVPSMNKKLMDILKEESIDNSFYKLKVGDVVELKDNLYHENFYGKHIFNKNGMLKGVEVTVDKVYSSGSFKIDKDSLYTYTPEMIKKIVSKVGNKMELKVGDVVIIKDDLIHTEMYGYSDWNNKMRCGSLNPVTVTDINYDNETFQVAEDVYVYSFQMIEDHKNRDVAPQCSSYYVDQIELHNKILNDISNLLTLCDGLAKNKSEMKQLLFKMLEIFGVK